MRSRRRCASTKAVNATVLLAVVVGVLFLLRSSFSWSRGAAPDAAGKEPGAAAADKLAMRPILENPVLVDVSTCTQSLFSSCRLKDGWKRYEKDLFLRSHWFYRKYIVYLERDVSHVNIDDLVVTSMSAVSPLFAETIPRSKLALSDRESIKLFNEHNWELKDSALGLWVKREKFSSQEGAVTAFKILFGSDVTYPVWKWRACRNSLEQGRDEYSMPYLFYRVGARVPMPKPLLKFNHENRFRIAQISDLHMSTGRGACRDMPKGFGDDSEGVCRADWLTICLVYDMLGTSWPDLVVFSGDLIHGSVSPDPETALIKAVLPAIDLDIPFCAIWGNHDNEGGTSNYDLSEILMDLPLSAMEHGPESLPGDGNYVVTVSPKDSDAPALSLYMLDTHGLSKEPGSTYDWAKKEQADWVLEKSAALKRELQDYDGTPQAMAFMHIPPPLYLISVKELRVGELREVPSSSGKEEGIMDALFAAGVRIFNAGHDHANDFCQFLHANPKYNIPEDIYLCYGGGAGYAGYGGYPNALGKVHQRRIRFFDVDLNTDSVRTFHRVERHSGHANRFTLVKQGVVRQPDVVEDTTHVDYLAEVVVDPGAPLKGLV